MKPTYSSSTTQAQNKDGTSNPFSNQQPAIGRSRIGAGSPPTDNLMSASQSQTPTTPIKSTNNADIKTNPSSNRANYRGSMAIKPIQSTDMNYTPNSITPSSPATNAKTSGTKSIAEIINERLNRKSIPYKSLSPIQDEDDSKDSAVPEEPEDRQELLKTLATQFSVPEEQVQSSPQSNELEQNTIPLPATALAHDSTPKRAAFIQTRTDSSTRLRTKSAVQLVSDGTTSTTTTTKETSEQTDHQKEPSFFTRVVRAARKILEHVKSLKELKEDETNENQIIDLAKATARSTIDLITLIKENLPDEKDMNLKQQQVLDSAMRVKVGVLSFIAECRSYYSNPYDFLSKQKLTNSGSDVVNNIREVLQAAELLRQMENDEKNEDLHRKLSNELLEAAKRINSALHKVTEIVETGRGNLNDAITESLSEASYLMNTATQRGDTTMANRLKDVVLVFANSARATANNRRDPIALSQYAKSSTDFIAAVKEFLASYCGRFIKGILFDDIIRSSHVKLARITQPEEETKSTDPIPQENSSPKLVAEKGQVVKLQCHGIELKNQKPLL